MKTKLLLVLVLTVFSIAAAKTSMHVPAIDAQGRGILTIIEATVVPGDGDVYVAVEPLVSVETQQSERVAAKIAAELAGANRSNYDVLYKIVAQAEVVDGPSGGAAMTLLAYSEFSGKKLRGDIAVTGTIEPGGGIGKIGGVLAKAEVVAKAGKKIFLIPAGQNVQEGVDIVDYAAQQWGLQIIEVANIREAAKIAATPEGTAVETPRRIAQPLVLVKISPSKALEPFLSLAEVELRELNATIERLRGKVRDLLLKSAVEAINTSQELIEKGYYYSAANMAFVAKITLEAAAANMTQQELSRALSELKKESEVWLPPQKTADNFEWVAGGELRYRWAMQRIEEAHAKLLVRPAAVVAKDYFSAKSWLLAAKRIASLGERVGGNASSELAVAELARNTLKEANLSLAEGADSEALFHLAAAHAAFDASNYIASLYDTQFAIAFHEASREAMGKTAFEIERMLENESSLMKYNSSVWSELYFTNSLYNVAEYNRSQDSEFLVNALKLQRLAKRLNDVVIQVRSRLAGAPSEVRVVTPTPAPTPTPMTTQIVETTPSSVKEISVTTAVASEEKKLLLLLLVVGVVAVIAGALMIARPRPAKPKVMPAKEALDRLDNLLIEGRISERTWKLLRRKYLAKAGEERTAPQPPDAAGVCRGARGSARP